MDKDKIKKKATTNSINPVQVMILIITIFYGVFSIIDVFAEIPGFVNLIVNTFMVFAGILFGKEMASKKDILDKFINILIKHDTDFNKIQELETLTRLQLEQLNLYYEREGQKFREYLQKTKDQPTSVSFVPSQTDSSAPVSPPYDPSQP